MREDFSPRTAFYESIDAPACLSPLRCRTRPCGSPRPRRIETPPLTIQSPGAVNNTNDTLTAQLVIEADCSGAGVSGTVLIRSVELVKVA